MNTSTMSTTPMSEARRLALLEVAQLHARRFDELARRRWPLPAPVIRLTPIPPSPVCPSSRRPLSPRQLEVLQLVADGLASKTIARELDVSEETIKSHLKRITTVLEANNRAHMVAIAFRRGLLPASEDIVAA
jgi:DNA-binding CsgD family transcriptional regulator